MLTHVSYSDCQFPTVSLLLTLISLYAPFISSLFLFISSELAGESVEDSDDGNILTLAEKTAPQNTVAAGTTPAFYPRY